MAGKINLSGRRATASIEGNDNITSNKTYSLPTTAGELVVQETIDSFGSYDPEFTTTDGNFSVSGYDVRHGNYLVIGDLVYVTGRVQTNGAGSGTGDLGITLPFTPRTANVQGNIQFNGTLSYVTGFSGAHPHFAFIQGGILQFRSMNMSNGGVSSAIASTAVTDSSDVGFSCVYIKA